MKKVILVALIFMIALSGAFALKDGLHYGFESHVDYDMVLNDDTVPNEAAFVFNPYFRIDNVFELKLRAAWKPLADGNNGFDYLFDFRTDDFYLFVGSVLNYLDTLKFQTGLFDFGIVRTSSDDSLRVLTKVENLGGVDYETAYKAYVRLNAQIVKAFAESTDFVAVPGRGYHSAQHAGAEFNVGLVGVVAEAFHEGYSEGSLTIESFKSHRFIGKAGIKMSTLVKLFEFGNYITTDIVNEVGGGPSYALFDRWLVEVNGKLNAGPFVVDATLFYNNQMPDKVLPEGSKSFGITAKATANFNDFFDLKLYGTVPVKFDPFEFVRDSDNVTYDKFGAEVKVGKWWYVGGGLEINHLISDLEEGRSVKEMVDANELWLKCGLNTKNLDVYAKGTVLNLDGFVTKLSIGATFRADNFLAYPSK